MVSKKKIKAFYKEFAGTNVFSTDFILSFIWVWSIVLMLRYPPNLISIIEMMFGSIIGTEIWKTITIFIIILIIFGFIIPFMMCKRYYKHLIPEINPILDNQNEQYDFLELKKVSMKCSFALIFIPTSLMIMYIPLNFYELVIYMMVIITFLPIGILKRSYLRQIKNYMKYHKIREFSNLQYMIDYYSLLLSTLITVFLIFILIIFNIYPIYALLFLHSFLIFYTIFKRIKNLKRLNKIFSYLAVPIVIVLGLLFGIALIKIGLADYVLNVP